MKHLMNKTLTVKRLVEHSDGQGGWIKSYEVVGQIKGRISRASIAERTIAAQQQVEISHVVYCMGGEDIRRGDLVTDGRVAIEIIGVNNPSMIDHHYECPGVEVKNG